MIWFKNHEKVSQLREFFEKEWHPHIRYSEILDAVSKIGFQVGTAYVPADGWEKNDEGENVLRFGRTIFNAVPWNKEEEYCCIPICNLKICEYAEGIYHSLQVAYLLEEYY